MCKRHGWEPLIEAMRAPMPRRKQQPIAADNNIEHILDEDDPEAALLDAVADAEPLIVGGLDDLWSEQQDLIEESDVAAMISAGVVSVVWLEALRRTWKGYLDGAWRDAWLGTAEKSRSALDGFLAARDIELSRFSDLVSAEIDRFAARRLQNFTQQQHDALMAILRQGIDTSPALHPRDLARRAREIVPLDTRQARAVVKMRTALEEAGETADAVDRAVTRRIKRMRAERAERILITDTAEAFNGAAEAQMEELRNLLEPGETLAKQNIEADDERTDACCAAVHMKILPVDEDFEPDGCPPRSRPPFHVRCRGRVVPVIVRGPITFAPD